MEEENIMEYNIEIDDIDLDKGIPLKYRDGKYYCGACGKRIPLKIKAHYCHKCGVKLLWLHRG